MLVDVPAEHARLIRPFVHWFLLRRARRRAGQRPHPAVAGDYLRTRIRVALDLLAWLDGQHIALGELDQPTLERWLTSGNTTSYTIRYFLNWAATHELAPSLSVPTLRRGAPHGSLMTPTGGRCCAAA